MDSQTRGSLPVSGVIDVVSVREEALQKFRQIKWNDYTRSDVFSLTSEDIENLNEIEMIMSNPRHNKEDVDIYLEEKGQELCSALITLITHITESSVVKYALARIDTLIPDSTDSRHRVNYFMQNGVIDITPFLRLVRAGHGYTEHAASTIMAKILSARPHTYDIETLLSWVIQSLSVGSNAELLSEPARSGSARAAVNCLMTLFINEKAREIFTDLNGLSLLATLLKHCQSRAQLSYEICFVLWTLTFCEKAIENFGTSGAVAALIPQVINAPREKVVRVALAALKNLLGKQDGIFNERMIEAGLIKTLTTMRERRWTDEDLVQDIQDIREALLRDFKELTTMERYEKELKTNKLEWGLLHTDQFWRENYMAFEQKEFELIVLLIELLGSDDPTTVSVALYDLGDFVRFYPNGKLIVKRLGGKKIVMNLLTSDHSEVQKHALQCMSKIMVNNWEFIK